MTSLVEQIRGPSNPAICFTQRPTSRDEPMDVHAVHLDEVSALEVTHESQAKACC